MDLLIYQSFTRAGEITSRLSKDTDLMAKTVCLNVNVMLRTLIKTLGVIYFMLNLSWKLTFLVLMEVPLTGLVQNIYDKHYQVISDDGSVYFYKLRPHLEIIYSTGCSTHDETNIWKYNGTEIYEKRVIS